MQAAGPVLVEVEALDEDARLVVGEEDLSRGRLVDQWPRVEAGLRLSLEQ